MLQLATCQVVVGIFVSSDNIVACLPIYTSVHLIPINDDIFGKFGQPVFNWNDLNKTSINNGKNRYLKFPGCKRLSWSIFISSFIY